MALTRKRLHVDQETPEPEVIAEAASVLARGGVVAYPTETFYGLAASAFDVVGCRRIFEIKGRAVSRALPCIVSGPEQLESLASELAPTALRLVELFWPGPLTLIVTARASVAASSEDGTIAVRESPHPVARALAAACGPVTSTSANRSGAPAATTADEVEMALGGALDLILDGGASQGAQPSTIVDVSRGELKLVREGVVSFRDVCAALEDR